MAYELGKRIDTWERLDAPLLDRQDAHALRGFAHTLRFSLYLSMERSLLDSVRSIKAALNQRRRRARGKGDAII